MTRDEMTPRRHEREETTRDKMIRDEMTGDEITRNQFEKSNPVY
jgi:hypothetical protein